MEKLSFAFPLTKEQKEMKQKLADDLYKNKQVKQWLNTFKQDKEFLYQHTAKFKDWVEQNEKCLACQGLDFCAQPRHGQLLNLKMDGILMECIEDCTFLKQHKEALKHRRQYRICDMSDRLLQVQIGNAIRKNDQNDYKRLVNDLVDLLIDESAKKGFYLYGAPGVGKTYLCAAAANQYAQKGKSIAFVNVPKFISDIKSLFQDNDGLAHRLNVVKRSDIVFFDDIGGESITRWSRDEILLPLLDYRMEHEMLTFFTSNLSFDDLYTHFVNISTNMQDEMGALRLMERIKALSCEKIVKGGSRRL